VVAGDSLVRRLLEVVVAVATTCWISVVDAKESQTNRTMKFIVADLYTSTSLCLYIYPTFSLRLMRFFFVLFACNQATDDDNGERDYKRQWLF
jgi:membrane protein CcdC involved in cytochrome C biogenesis